MARFTSDEIQEVINDLDAARYYLPDDDRDHTFQRSLRLASDLLCDISDEVLPPKREAPSSV